MNDRKPVCKFSKKLSWLGIETDLVKCFIPYLPIKFFINTMNLPYLTARKYQNSAKKLLPINFVLGDEVETKPNTIYYN